MRHQHVLEYKNYFYFKLTLVVVLGSICAYLLARTPEDSPQFAFGSTLTGYGLGTVGALLIVWLTWFGVQKRRYRARGAPLQGWLSAHVYLGFGLIFIATLHTGFHFGWNLHTLTYVLMLAVIFSGMYGVYAYLRVPQFMTVNLGPETLETLLAKIGDLDREAHAIALQLPDEVNQAVAASALKTIVGGGVWSQLRARQRNDPTHAALALLEKLGKDFKGERVKQAHQLYSILARRATLVRQARRDIKFKALLQIWLFVHIPLTVALLAALLGHIVSIFFFW